MNEYECRFTFVTSFNKIKIILKWIFKFSNIKFDA